MTTRVIVVGGGITGLTAAWRIQQAFQASNTPLNLQVLESSSHWGGAIKSEHRENFLIERGPDCFISDKPAGLQLCRDLGLEPELIGVNPDHRRSFILRKGQFYSIPEGFYLLGPSRTRPFLESGLLSWPGKLRALLEPLMPKRSQTDESLASFVQRRFGQELLDWMAQPLVAGIYGADPERLSLRATFPQFLEMEKKFGSVMLGLKKQQKDTLQASGARYSLFVTLRHGMQTLTDHLAAKLGSLVLKSQARVKEIRKLEKDWQIVQATGEVLMADAVCLALPSHVAANLVQPFDPDLSDDLAAIDYTPAATIHFAFRQMDIKRPLDGVGFVVPQKENRLVLGCTFVHNKFEGRVPRGFALIRAFLGGTQSIPWIHEKEERLMNQVLKELGEWLGLAGKPLFSHLERFDRALPQYEVGHLPRVLRIEERLFRHKGLTVAGNWQYGVGIPDCIESGERAARFLLKSVLGAERV